jgi:predicted enzyme related to lactoylglutathione lyase
MGLMPNPVAFLEIVGPDGPALQLGVALDRVTAAGGVTIVPPTRLPWVYFALFQDPAGNLTGLLAE